ncbi:hypothetical protein [Streptomyces youssoufiensis]
MRQGRNWARAVVDCKGPGVADRPAIEEHRAQRAELGHLPPRHICGPPRL